ncbi:unnamed protein product [Tuber melanosporum]|uniref:(Perigord truffle) hypothetical protein n=1 Tax=Tuber melanosporum (strain Mel28) TaxID=656061 RepID=D5GBW0_TUBMM|nr:uncharacterized protein GSTUM_00005612001 [Tuber melanosporum]CAZ81960.1 unnamed protein product [Tuber melanosporum]
MCFSRYLGLWRTWCTLYDTFISVALGGLSGGGGRRGGWETLFGVTCFGITSVFPVKLRVFKSRISVTSHSSNRIILVLVLG